LVQYQLHLNFDLIMIQVNEVPSVTINICFWRPEVVTQAVHQNLRLLCK